MAMGLPVIATNWRGSVDYLDETSGTLIEPRGRERFIADLAQAMVSLARSGKLGPRLGRFGRAGVATEFDWEKKIERILSACARASRLHRALKDTYRIV
jgi:glycosyltransferase involved in cell wall biosynthesis